jgi:hypothetical protein
MLIKMLFERLERQFFSAERKRRQLQQHPTSSSPEAPAGDLDTKANYINWSPHKCLIAEGNRGLFFFFFSRRKPKCGSAPMTQLTQSLCVASLQLGGISLRMSPITLCRTPAGTFLLRERERMRLAYDGMILWKTPQPK